VALAQLPGRRPRLPLVTEHGRQRLDQQLGGGAAILHPLDLDDEHRARVAGCDRPNDRGPGGLAVAWRVERVEALDALSVPAPDPRRCRGVRPRIRVDDAEGGLGKPEGFIESAFDHRAHDCASAREGSRWSTIVMELPRSLNSTRSMSVRMR